MTTGPLRLLPRLLITAIDAEPFRLVLGSGTALRRAHRLTRRMPGDIDVKIVGRNENLAELWAACAVSPAHC